ncbi:MAG: porin, partial [Undibacterium sp.]|nr:porin [Undibacterium sp.]
GLKANFNLEGTLANDTGAAGAGFGPAAAAAGGPLSQAGSSTSLFDRLSWVGLSGDFGSVTFGRNNILGVDSVGLADPLSLAHAGSNPNVAIVALNLAAFHGNFGTNGGGSGLRQNNSVKYLTPMVSGFGAAAMYGFGEKAGDSSANSYKGLSGYFTDGKSGVALAYAKLEDATAASTLTQWGGGGKLKMDAFTFKLTYAQTEVNTTNRKLAVIGGGVDYAMSATTTLTGAYYNSKRSGDASGDLKVDQYIIMPKYAFSKRTTAYASYTYSKAGKTLVAPMDVAMGLGIIGGGQSDANRLAVGVMHAF